MRRPVTGPRAHPGPDVRPPGGLGHYPPGQGGAAYPGYWKRGCHDSAGGCEPLRTDRLRSRDGGAGALGTPWLFAQIEAYLRDGTLLPPPRCPNGWPCSAVRRNWPPDIKGNAWALLQARKHAAWYMRGCGGAAEYRRAAGTLETMEDLYTLCRRVAEETASEQALSQPFAEPDGGIPG